MGWIENYLEYAKPLESPRVFHFWSAITLLGHVLGRRCWVDRGGRYKVFPGQIMTILVARSAIARKSTAIQLATPFLNAVPPWAAYQLPSKLSPQQLIREMHDISMDGTLPRWDPSGRRRDSCGLIVADELGFFFTSEEFARALPTHICAFNDAPPGDKRFTFRSWAEVVWNACVGMLGGTTPKGLAEELPEVARQAGFLGRTIIVYGEPEGDPNPLTGAVTPQDQELKLRLEEELNEIAHLAGEFQWSRKGRAVYDDWYVKHHKWVKENIDAGAESDDTGYYGRKGDHVVRVAAVMSASSSDEMVLRAGDVERAIAALADNERNMPKAFSEMGVHHYAALETRILNILDRHKNWIPRWKLMQGIRRYGDKRTREQAIDSLTECREIRVDRKDGVTYIRRRRNWE
jgi:hypothetical protein